MSENHMSCLSQNSSTKNLPLNFVLILFLVLPLVACPLWGQVGQKKDLTSKDYHLWGLLSLDKISPDQQWVSYTMSYKNTIDTLFVRNATTGKTYNFPSAQRWQFTTNNTFVCLNAKGLELLELGTGKQQFIKSVDTFSYSAPTDLLIFTVTLPEGQKKLIIQSPTGTIQNEIAGVSNFSLSPDQQQLVYATVINNKHAVMLLNLKKPQQQKWLLLNSEGASYGFTWQKQGKSLAFALKNSDPQKNKLFYYTLLKDQLLELDPVIYPSLPEHTFIPADFTFTLSISDDMQRVFFTLKQSTEIKENSSESTVEIWNANDKSLFIEKEKNGSLATAPREALWLPMSQLVTPLTTSELPKMILSGDQQYAFLFNPKAYEPQFKLQQGPTDIYILNLRTFEKKLLLKESFANPYELIPSPNGKYIAYFKNDNWWVYNFALERHYNITQNINVKFTSVDPHYSITTKKINAGWSLDDKEILLYDDFDLWAIKPDGSSFRRLTHGRELKIRYRLTNTPGRQLYTNLYDGQETYSYDLEKELFLHGQGEDGKTGYFKWNKNSAEKAIVYDNSHIDQLTYTAEKQNLYYRQQRFDLSPRLMLKKKESVPESVFQSNPQQENYFWGSSELIEYANSKGQKMKGILRYPAHYDPQKKYPMIVHIYQRQNQEQHKYVNPSLYLEDSDNDALWTTQGYFVLRPDILIESDILGYSALDCVTAAVKKVMTKDVVNPSKIGLMGHSFGGYESNFIITQTNLFAAAISSAGSTDLTSFYFTLAKNFYFPNMYRFTDGQWKISQTPFDTPELYYRNSPITYADKVNTPLLMWSGKEDFNVDPHQSMEFYFALRRLGKKCIMLLYPEEGHAILKPVNQKDMGERVQQWFAYYLKDDLSAQWISDGVK